MSKILLHFQQETQYLFTKRTNSGVCKFIVTLLYNRKIKTSAYFGYYGNSDRNEFCNYQWAQIKISRFSERRRISSDQSYSVVKLTQVDCIAPLILFFKIFRSCKSTITFSRRSRQDSQDRNENRRRVCSRSKSGSHLTHTREG